MVVAGASTRKSRFDGRLTQSAHGRIRAVAKRGDGLDNFGHVGPGKPNVAIPTSTTLEENPQVDQMIQVSRGGRGRDPGDLGQVARGPPDSLVHQRNEHSCARRIRQCTRHRHKVLHRHGQPSSTCVSSASTEVIGLDTGRMEILNDSTFVVPHVPRGSTGVAWLRSHVARFAEGADHVRRREAAVRLLEKVPLDRLRRPGHPVATLAEALGLPRHLASDVDIVAASYQPHDPVTPEADQAVGRLVNATGGRWNEDTAALIGLLVQASGATRSAITGNRPPVPTTRRTSPSGEEVLVDLSRFPFGAGRHACPGEQHAEALLDGVGRFPGLHDADEPLLLPNAWDFASAAALVRRGYLAIGTTSLGVAASRGLPDAVGSTYRETLELARSLARLPVPITVDIEAGFGVDAGELAAELTTMGVAGVNIEDGRGDRLESVDEQCDRVSALKAAAPELFVNARVDTYWLGLDHESTSTRATAYVDAGADGVFVPGLRDEPLIEDLVGVLGRTPLNVLAEHPFHRLRELGVRRVSTGSLLYRTAITQAVAAADAYRAGVSAPTAMSYDHIEETRRHVLPEPR